MCVWDVSTSTTKVVARGKLTAATAGDGGEGLGFTVASLAWHPEANTLALGDYCGRLAVWRDVVPTTLQPPLGAADRTTEAAVGPTAGGSKPAVSCGAFGSVLSGALVTGAGGRCGRGCGRRCG